MRIFDIYCLIAEVTSSGCGKIGVDGGFGDRILGTCEVEHDFAEKHDLAALRALLLPWEDELSRYSKK